MALSYPMKTAQTVILCQFCDESPEIKWQCINCDLLLCQFCNQRIHSKSKSSVAHQIINLVDCGTEKETENFRKADLRKMECGIHDEKTCVLFCSVCDIPICPTCIVNDHKTHEFNELEQEYETKLGKVKVLKETIESDIMNLKNDKTRQEMIMIKGEEDLEDKRRSIKQREKEVHQAVREYSLSLLQKLETEWKKKSAEKIKMANVELQKELDSVIHALQSHKAWDIFRKSSSQRKVLLDKLSENSSEDCLKFVAGKIRTEGIVKMIGYICPRNAPELVIFQTYCFLQNDETRFDIIFKILSLEEDSVFVASKQVIGEQIILRKLKFNGSEIEEASFKDIMQTNETMDMDILPSGDIILTTGKNEVIKYTTDGELDIIHSFSCHQTRGIHVNKQGNLLVGLQECYENHGKVKLLTSDFEEQKNYEYDKDNEIIFTLPFKIQSTSKNNICVIDRLDTNLVGRLVTFKEDGEVLWIYKGCDQVNSDTEVFTPTDIAITKTDLILISDFNNHVIHILDDKGGVVCFKSLIDFQNTFPISIDLDKDGKLWLVSFSKMNNVTIHHVGLE